MEIQTIIANINTLYSEQTNQINNLQSQVDTLQGIISGNELLINQKNDEIAVLQHLTDSLNADNQSLRDQLANGTTIVHSDCTSGGDDGSKATRIAELENQVSYLNNVVNDLNNLIISNQESVVKSIREEYHAELTSLRAQIEELLNR